MQYRVGMTAVKKKPKIKNTVAGYLFISPVVLGVLIFTAFPMIVSLYYSFTNYTVIFGPPDKFGVFNYVNAFTVYASETWSSLIITFLYTLITVPIGMVLGFALGYFMNQKTKGIGIFRVLYYLPVVLPAIVASLLWQNLADMQKGVLNYLLSLVHLGPFSFFQSAETALPSLFFMSLFQLGGGMVMWLAQLKAIPPDYYEAASLDGAGFWTKMFRITIPMCTPMIFYNLLINVITTLQTFSTAFLLLNDLNRDSMNFFVIRIYGQAMLNNQMGEACALSWILFVVVGLISVVVFKTSKWVYYGEDN